MGMVKRKMMEVQEEAVAAYEKLDEANPYVGTTWERIWQEAWDFHADAYGAYIDRVAEAEDYARCPDLAIDYLSHLG